MADAASEGKAAARTLDRAASDMSAKFMDPSFLQSVLGSLPGVDPNDPRIQSVLNAMPQNPEDKKEEGNDAQGGGLYL